MDANEACFLEKRLEIIGDGIAQDMADYLGRNGYSALRVMPSGELAGVSKFIFTYGLMLGVDWYGYRTRWCYESEKEAVSALKAWDGEGSPPGLWIKQKPEDVHGPGSQKP